MYLFHFCVIFICDGIVIIPTGISLLWLYIVPLKVVVPKTKLEYHALNPSSWNNKELKEWIANNVCLLIGIIKNEHILTYLSFSQEIQQYHQTTWLLLKVVNSCADYLTLSSLQGIIR